MMEPNYADIDGLFYRRGNRDLGGWRRSWRWLSRRERYQPAHAGGLQAGTQDVGGTDNRRDGTRGAGAACGCDEPRCGAGTGANPATKGNTAPAAANAAKRGVSAIGQ